MRIESGFTPIAVLLGALILATVIDAEARILVAKLDEMNLLAKAGFSLATETAHPCPPGQDCVGVAGPAGFRYVLLNGKPVISPKE